MNALSGLCVSCRNAATCTFLKDRKTPVLQCEEFDGFPSLLGDPEKCSRQSHTEFKWEDLNPHKGLCSICENRETCTYPRPEGGVWHCDEYR